MSDTTKNETLKIEITQAKILDCLMHGATREDIAELRAETNANITGLRAETKNSIDSLRHEIKADIARLDDKMDTKFRWLIGLMFGGFTLMLGGLTTIGVMIFNFMK